jgi:hypothetical protein
VIVLAAAGCGGDDENDSTAKSSGAQGAASGAAQSGTYSARVTNPLFPVSVVRHMVYEGKERGDSGETVTVRAVNQTLDRKRRIAGAPVATVDVKEYENGEIVEHTRDYYSQHRNGSVWYFGEHVDNYKDGKVVHHEGQWIAGKGNARAGLFMPANPKVGQRFDQERAPGVAEDRSTVVQEGVRVKTRAGKFRGCIKTRDFGPLDKSTEFKFYCPRVGLVREQGAGGGKNDLISYR